MNPPFSSERWGNRIKELVEAFGRKIEQKSPHFIYGMMGGLTLWPLVEGIAHATQSGQSMPLAVYTSLGTIAGGLGGNLIAEQLQRWKDRADQPTQEEVSTWVAETAPTNPELREALDKLITHFEVIQQTEKQLTPTDRDWFIETLQTELQKLPPTTQTTLTVRDGEIAHGNDNIIVAKQGSHVGRDVNAPVVTGNHNIVHLTKIYQSGEGEPLLDEKKFAEAVVRYLEWVGKRYGKIRLRGLHEEASKVTLLTLQEVYVSLTAQLGPDLVRKRSAQEREEREVKLSELLSESKRLAVIGGPGCGKTTYLHWIAILLADGLLRGKAENTTDHLGLSAPLPLPILVNLSEFNRYRRECAQGKAHLDDPRKGTLHGYLSHALIHQDEGVRLPADFFPRLLADGRHCFLLLDGVDEVANEDERGWVLERIERLSEQAGVGHVVVTSRTRAWQGGKGLETFRPAHVQPLKMEQIAQLVRRWCGAAYDETSAKREADDLLKQIGRLEAFRQMRGQPPLIDSPLLVTLIAIVHYNNHTLPDERADLYYQCVKLLGEDHHKSKTVQDELLADLPKPPNVLLAEVAWRMMCQGKRGREISEVILKQWLREILLGDEQGVERFIAFLRQREGVMMERGGSYSFIHLTFQEFLAAQYMVSELLDVEQIIARWRAKKALGESWWREQILLTVGFRSVRFDNDTAKAEALAWALADLPQNAKDAVAGAELAGMALSEIPKSNPTMRRRVAERLVEWVCEQPISVPPALRLLVGDTLARLGDPRRGVGVRADGLPDLAWGMLIPAGNYTIGGDKQAWGSFDTKTVLIPTSYQLARYPITNAQFDCFVRAQDVADPRWWAGMPEEEKKFDDPEWPIANRPRERVSWYQAIAFCRWLSHHLKETISLPHEYQWEVAARYVGNGRCDGRVYPWGDEQITAEHANYDQTKLKQTSAVGLFPHGHQPHSELDDLSGNVWEWCANKYKNPDVSDVDRSDDWRTLRGGSCNNNSSFCRAASRLNDHPFICIYSFGFRVVRVLTPH